MSLELYSSIFLGVDLHHSIYERQSTIYPANKIINEAKEEDATKLLKMAISYLCCIVDRGTIVLDGETDDC